MNSKEEAAIKKIFDSFDQEKKGKISPKQLRLVLSKLLDIELPSEREIYKQIEEFDLDKDGKLDFQEFCRFYRKKIQEAQISLETEAKGVFAMIDKNNNGTIDPGELFALFNKLGTPIPFHEIRALINQYDDNFNGNLEFQEFYKLYVNLTEKTKA